MRLFLIRHGLIDSLGVSLPGRTPGVTLNRAGRAQLGPLVARVARRLAGARLDAVIASPLARAQQTGAAIARAHGLPVTCEPALLELDFGRWTNRAIADLGADADWVPFNSYRSGTPAGGAELAVAVQARAVAALLARARATPDATIAAVSHGDVVRAVLAHVMGVPIDLQLRLEISPASVSEIELRPWGPRVLALNDVS
ncbi:MAG TPA: histidine phosphatase family protein [Gemmatirosa sp.]